MTERKSVTNLIRPPHAGRGLGTAAEAAEGVAAFPSPFPLPPTPVRLGPNGALGADDHQWILYRAGNAVSFVHSTKLILARCIREERIELSPEGRAALDALADDFSTWRANPTWRGTPLPSGALPPVAVDPTGSWSPSSGEGHPAPVSDAAADLAVAL